MFLIPALLSAVLETTAALPGPRRVITAEDAAGKAVVLADGASANARVLNGSRITRLWETDRAPARLGVTRDEGATAGNAYREGFAGTSLYTADLPPGLKIDMHRQDSLDYIAVLTGEVDVLLETGFVRLRQGDVLIQAGNLHGWANPTAMPSRILVVVVTGERKPPPPAAVKD